MSKKKYYFGDRLVRTSDRTYSHVVLRGDDVLSCCGSLVLAEKEMTRWKNRAAESIRFNQNCLDALQAGKTSIRYTYRVGVRSFTYTCKITESPEYYRTRISELKDMISSYRVEPLEVR